MCEEKKLDTYLVSELEKISIEDGDVITFKCDRKLSDREMAFLSETMKRLGKDMTEKLGKNFYLVLLDNDFTMSKVKDCSKQYIIDTVVEALMNGNNALKSALRMSDWGVKR